MTPDEAAAAAVQFLTYFVEGSRNPQMIPPSPEFSGWPGIFLRCPATVGPAPEHEVPPVSPFDEQCFAAGDGPETCSEPYVFVDMCPICRVRITQAGTTIHATFDGIVDFPASAFPVTLSAESSVLAGKRVLLPASMAEPMQISAECMERLQQYLGPDINLLSISYDVAVMCYEDYDGSLT